MIPPPLSPSSLRLDRLAQDLDRFRAFVQKRVGDLQRTEDILQDAFARAAAAIDDLRDDERLDAWFYRILRNRISDSASARAIVPITSDPAGPEQDMMSVCGCLTPLIDRLSPEHRDALRVVDLEGHTTEHAARTLGITVNTLTVRRHRARHNLRLLLEATCGMCASAGCRDCHCDRSP